MGNNGCIGGGPSETEGLDRFAFVGQGMQSLAVGYCEFFDISDHAMIAVLYRCVAFGCDGTGVEVRRVCGRSGNK